jgi:hypothetical protein
MEKRGKTINITSRLPDFYDSENLESLLYQFIDIFGQILEAGETDLIKVMRSHYVDTADNQGSQGFITSQKGDLDKIFALYLEALGGTAELVKLNYQFSQGSVKNIDNLAKKIQQETGTLSQYLRAKFSSDNLSILTRYQIINFQFNLESFLNSARLAIKILIKNDEISKYLYSQLSPETQKIINQYDGSEPAPANLTNALVHELNKQLKNPSLYRQNRQYFTGKLSSIEVEQLNRQFPTGEALYRLNRKLLEIAYPEEIKPSNIPAQSEVETALINELNKQLTNSSLYQDNRQYFDRLTLPEEVNKLLQQSTPANLEYLNRRLLEAAYPNEIESSIDPYRRRFKGLIQILRQGAATKQGIIDIVAANLGIVGDDAASQAAKQQIQIEEYLPELITQSFTISPHPETSGTIQLPFPQIFNVKNPNLIPTPANIRLTLRDNREQKSLPLQPLVNPCLVNSATQETIEYKGTLTLNVNSVLEFLSNGTVLLDGVKQPQIIVPIIPLGESNWSLKSLIGETEGRFDQTFFNLSVFDKAETEPKPLNPEQASNFKLEVKVELIKKTPGVFRVRIPWDIPGFTDKFDETGEHPRHQITAIIEKVKAAGVLSIISYEKIWQESQEMIDQLTVKRSPFIEEHIAEEANFDIGSYQIPYPGGIHHEMSDKLVLSGVFDYTGFDTGNRFA